MRGYKSVGEYFNNQKVIFSKDEPNTKKGHIISTHTTDPLNMDPEGTGRKRVFYIHE